MMLLLLLRLRGGEGKLIESLSEMCLCGLPGERRVNKSPGLFLPVLLFFFLPLQPCLRCI